MIHHRDTEAQLTPRILGKNFLCDSVVKAVLLGKHIEFRSEKDWEWIT
jgi:hypothetical protein